MSSLVHQLRQRGVFKAVALYAGAAWFIAGALDILLPIVDAPEWVMRVYLGSIVVGLPVVLMVSWFYRITPSGIETDTGQGSSRGLAGVALIGTVLAAAAVVHYFAISEEFAPEDTASAFDTVIAVAPLRDLSPAGDLRWLAEGLTEEIRRQIGSWSEYKILHRSKSNIDLNALDKVPAGQLLEGYLQGSDEKVVLVLSLVDLPSGDTIWQEEFTGKTEDPLTLQGRVATYAARYFDETASPNSGPANPEAYQAFLKSLHYQFLGDTQEQVYWTEKAIAADPDWQAGWLSLVDPYMQIYHALGDPQDARKATEALEKSVGLPGYNLFNIFHTTYLKDDFEKGEEMARAYLLDETHVWSIGAYARLLQESGLHQSAANAFKYITDEMPLFAPAWYSLTVSRLHLRDFTGAREAAEKFSLLVPTGSGVFNDTLRLTVAALEGDEALARDLLDKSEAHVAMLPQGSMFRTSGMDNSKNFIRMSLALALGDVKEANRLVESAVATGRHTLAANGYLKLGDETAAAAQFKLAEQGAQPGLYVWAHATLARDPAHRDHPLVLDHESSFGLTPQWRVELCRRAAALPPETHISCDISTLD